MNTTPERPAICDLTDLTDFWNLLLGSVPAYGRSLWLAFLDDTDRAHPAITQIDGLALSPDSVAVANLGDIVRNICADDPCMRGALICLERGGTHGASPFEESWADALTIELGTALPWPVMVRTPKGVSRVQLWTSAA